jgi:hypothetical protein
LTSGNFEEESSFLRYSHDGELSEGIDCHEQHDTNDNEIDKLASSALQLDSIRFNSIQFNSIEWAFVSYQGTGATRGKSSSRTDEETSTDGATDGNHLHVSILKLARERALSLNLDIFRAIGVTWMRRARGGLRDDLLLLVVVRHCEIRWLTQKQGWQPAIQR